METDKTGKVDAERAKRALQSIFRGMSGEALVAFEGAIELERQRRIAESMPEDLFREPKERSARPMVKGPGLASRKSAMAIPERSPANVEATRGSLSTTQRAAMDALVRDGESSPPAEVPPYERLRWYRTHGALVSRGLAMQDGERFLPTTQARMIAYVPEGSARRDSTILPKPHHKKHHSKKAG